MTPLRRSIGVRGQLGMELLDRRLSERQVRGVENGTEGVTKSRVSS